MNTKNWLYLRNAVLLIACFFLILSAGIMVPILFRPFYYAHIGALDLAQKTGLSPEAIRLAYDEMMDYCLGLSDTFRCGSLAFSAEGAAHFADVRNLFLLDLRVMVTCGAILGIHALSRLAGRLFNKNVPPARGRRHSVFFYSAISLLGAFVLIGALGAIDFSRFFVVFHHLFFPGKTNWVFDPRYDEIILILPEVFFRNCGICIAAVILFACAAIVIKDLSQGKVNGGTGEGA